MVFRKLNSFHLFFIILFEEKPWPFVLQFYRQKMENNVMDAIAVSLSIFIEIYCPRSKKNQFCNMLVMTEKIFVDERYETVYIIFINCLIVLVIYLSYLLLFITLASSYDYVCWFTLFRTGFLSLLCWKLFILLFFVMHWFLLVFLCGSYCVYIIGTCFCIVFFEVSFQKFYLFAVLYIHKVSPLK